MKKRYYLAFSVLLFSALFFLDAQTSFTLLVGTVKSVLRMLSAYVVSLVFSFTAGLLMLHNRKVFDVLFPICDVMQGVPVLGFFPVAIYFFIHYFPQGYIGQELASIFLIFTAMTWPLLFTLVEAGASFSRELRDVVLLLNLNPTRYLLDIFIPHSFPKLITASISAWGGGWYFLFASEYLVLGHERIALDGLGTFIALAAYNNDMVKSLLGLGMIAWLVLGVDVYVWQPLLKHVKNRWDKSYFGRRGWHPLIQWFIDSVRELIFLFEDSLDVVLRRLNLDVKSLVIRKIEASNPLLLPIAAVLAVLLLTYPSPLSTGLYLLVSSLATLFRLAVALSVSVFIALALALVIKAMPRLLSLLLPVLDIAQSIPGVALFPFIILFITKVIGGVVGVEVAVVVMLMTGMVWYLIFKLIGEVEEFPKNYDELATLLQVPWHTRLFSFLIPYLLPAIVVGSIQAVGGGWNATIVAEYILDESKRPITTVGLGYLINFATQTGDIHLLTLSVLTMVFLILLINKYVWQVLLKKASSVRW
jgi:NitT/TauT family transport system permease protein